MIERERLIKEVTALQNHQDVSESFLEEIRDDLYYYILKIVNDQSLAEDLTQDALVEILLKINNLQEPAAFVSWSKKIAYHRCTDFFKVRHDILLDEFEDGESIFDTLEDDRGEFLPEEAVEQEELKKEIHAMIMALPEDQRSAILLRYFDEMSVKEISETHGVSEGTIKSRLNYARKALKKAVENYEKKNGIKLRCAGVIPLLLWLFRQYRLEADVPLTKPNVSGQFFGETAGEGAAAAMAAGGSAVPASAAATTAAAVGHGITGVLGIRTIIGIIIGIVIIVIGILVPVIGKQPEPPVTEPPVIQPTESTAPGTTMPGVTVPETTQPETGETPTMPMNPTAPAEEETPTVPVDPTTTAPAEPDPTEPDPTETEPTEPDPTEPDPTEPDPTETEPTEPDPTETEPTEPEPTPPPGETPTMPIDPPPEDETPTMPL